ncbi:MAG: efflux RND transporter periplasmic adaptor subunit [Spirochaetaceae bacterium]|jgi:multidrug efflux pump subunit AcrA (membrane-fusion protein)|nr:efflux RND transporter periplasmic adaptor subunit [Spirochaetaceae bacterium]
MPGKKPSNNTSKAIIFLIAFFLILTIITTLTKKSGYGTAAPSSGSPSPAPNAQVKIPPGPGGGNTGSEGTGKRRGENTDRTGESAGGTNGKQSFAHDKNQKNAEGADTAADGTSNRQGQAAAEKQQRSGGIVRNPTVVRVTPIVIGEITKSIVVNGDIIASRQVSVFPQVSGKIAGLNKQVGDRVSKSEIIAYIDPSRPGEVFSNSPIRSTISGTVIQAPLNTGDTVSTQSVVYVIGDLSSLVIETYIPERFAGSIRKNLAAQISFDALPDSNFAGFVHEISPVIDPASRTMRIQIQLLKQDPRIQAGMFASINLIINTRSNVPLVPRESLINTYGKWIVFIVDERGIARRREISIGLESDTEAEVLSGLSPGDRVVSAGQNFLSDSEPVRITE